MSSPRAGTGWRYGSYADIPHGLEVNKPVGYIVVEHCADHSVRLTETFGGPLHSDLGTAQQVALDQQNDALTYSSPTMYAAVAVIVPAELPAGHATVSSIVAGEHPEGAVVTATGVANGPAMHTSVQGNKWVEFWLITPRTSVRVQMHPALYREQGHLLNPVKDEEGVPRPPALAITGEVRRRAMPPFHPQPALIASSVVPADGVVKNGDWVDGERW
jgi:hypothetical protein